jgi:hypothetical protein
VGVPAGHQHLQQSGRLSAHHLHPAPVQVRPKVFIDDKLTCMVCMLSRYGVCVVQLKPGVH